MSLLLPLLDQAKAKGALADAIDPATPDNLIDKVHRIVGGVQPAATADPQAIPVAPEEQVDGVQLGVSRQGFSVPQLDAHRLTCCFFGLSYML